jgi:hypothetical protein
MDSSVRAPSPTSAGSLDDIDLPQLLRLTGMTKALLTEVADVSLDDAARARLAEIQHRAIVAIAHGLPHELAQELNDLSAPPSADPSEGELRLVQAQLVGWLSGMFQAFQVAAVERQLQLAAPADGAAVEVPMIPARSSESGPYL